jgi:hypothetical protein
LYRAAPGEHYFLGVKSALKGLGEAELSLDLGLSNSTNDLEADAPCGANRIAFEQKPENEDNLVAEDVAAFERPFMGFGVRLFADRAISPQIITGPVDELLREIAPIVRFGEWSSCAAREESLR